MGFLSGDRKGPDFGVQLRSIPYPQKFSRRKLKINKFFIVSWGKML
jgi:hypothetical protein